jgi:antitoxin MazE
MDAKVVRWGDSLAIRLTADEVEQLGLREGQVVDVRAKTVGPIGGEAEPAATPRRFVNGLPVYTMAEMAAEMRRLGPDFEPPTVDWGPDVGSEIIDDDDPR